MAFECFEVDHNHMCIQFLLKYDIVCLNEINTPLPVCIPGYFFYKSYHIASSYRCGKVVLVKCYLANFTVGLDTSTEGQVLLRSQFMPRFVFSHCYIPPSHSPYFSYNSFAAIQ